MEEATPLTIIILVAETLEVIAGSTITMTKENRDYLVVGHSVTIQLHRKLTEDICLQMPAVNGCELQLLWAKILALF